MKLVQLVGTFALAACGMPLWHAPAPRPQAMPDPPQSPASLSRIDLAQEGCMGRCPVYEVTLTSSGVAHYEGKCFTPLLGAYDAPLDSVTFTRLARMVVESDFFKSDTALGMVIDAPYVVMTVTLTDARRRTVWYGLGHGALGQRIEGVTGLLSWHSAGPRPARACAT